MHGAYSDVGNGQTLLVVDVQLDTGLIGLVSPDQTDSVNNGQQ